MQNRPGFVLPEHKNVKKKKPWWFSADLCEQPQRDQLTDLDCVTSVPTMWKGAVLRKTLKTEGMENN